MSHEQEINERSEEIKTTTDKLSWQDHLGTLLVRLNINRMSYLVTPGLYRINDPDPTSPVLVTANYKLSFDHLRQGLKKQSAWILVLDTKGINVWCAAGKGTFGTEELVKRIDSVGLKKIVSHRQIIVPQLGAPGVAAHQVKATTGFKVIYGPIKANMIPEFIQHKYKATSAMQEVTFTFWERAVLIPLEIVQVLKYILPIGGVLIILSSINGGHLNLDLWFVRATTWIIVLLLTVLSGAVLTPLLLPYIPGRAFALKGFVMGIIMVGSGLWFHHQTPIFGLFGLLSSGLVIITGSSFLSMNFTGSSTYTSLSGVIKEMKRAIPWQKTGLITASVCWLLSIWLDRI